MSQSRRYATYFDAETSASADLIYRLCSLPNSSMSNLVILFVVILFFSRAAPGRRSVLFEFARGAGESLRNEVVESFRWKVEFARAHSDGVRS